MENAGWGASYAAPIASLMIEKYLKGSIAPDRQHMEVRMKSSNLIDKFLKSQQKEIESANRPAPPRDTLPAPQDVPTDVPEAEVRQNGRKR